ncbi:MAG: hypothetical protein SVT56_11785, partial [Chloroflexota bacterium]|nr:hypothetical protein [Chloroflexota bacterium]
MSRYGFNFETLYHLELETLYDLCQFIRGDDSKISPDYDVLIRGVLLPFFRDSTKTTRKSDKNTIMRLALVATAKKIGMDLEDWDKLSTNHIARIVRRHVQNLIVQKIDTLSPEEKEEVLGLAQNNLRESAKILGVPLTGAGAVLAGEMSGFSI